MLKGLRIILEFEIFRKHGAYLHYILCTVASTRIFIFVGFIFFGGVKQKPEIRQCSPKPHLMRLQALRESFLRLRDVVVFLASV